MRLTLNKPLRRITSGGFTVTQRVTPIVVDLDPRKLGAPVIRAISDLQRQQLRRVPGAAAPATVARRQSAQRNPTSRWVRQDYPLRPTRGQGRLFYDSGALAEGLRVEYDRRVDAWLIRAPQGRLRRSDFAGGNWPRFIRELHRRVPATDPQRAFRHRSVMHALEMSARQLHRKGVG